MFLEELYFNTCILISTLFIYMQVFYGHLRLSNNWLHGLFGGFLGNLLMFFSITVTENTIVDLRFIPVFLLMLFVGWSPAFLASVLIIGGRFLYGVNSSSIASLVLMLLLFIGFYFISMMKKSIIHKALFMLIYANIAFTIIISMIVFDIDALRVLVPIYWAVSFVCGIISVYVVSYLRAANDLFTKYKEKSTIDFLTGVYNVRYFDETFNEMAQKASDRMNPLALLYIDIDHFKRVNDQYGHDNGDQVLKQLSILIKENVRKRDLVARKGGEEFVVLLPNITSEEGRTLAENIREVVEHHAFTLTNGEHISCTISIGMAHFPTDSSSSQNIIKLADKALYQAKERGRNRVEKFTSREAS
ncbi:GGDEF domain-containing protein [Rossellomorea aquimaris]|uniref:GGDEF domain-containing protein n=1 Tax=Rossellomorea aquimaris TaxID=189382 RepID=UPI0007D07892|nr:diguanylate cyclase [Rossellomorea aquimaris]